ncbi:hypothetical protein LUZ60_017765 [Juncus effusus]|nr:hypothetical protein LUZ60_017765 [Juncus effusus]
MISSLLLTFSLLILTLIASPSQAQKSTQNITLGSSLTPTGPNSSWLSPSGEFAFGFRPLETNSSEFLLAIWFVNTVDKTTVWYANGNTPVSAGSSLQFTSSNQLLLQDSTGQNIWSAGVNGVTHAAMLDTGNFVLYNTTGLPRWQSFENPSDTILPSQVLQFGSTLTSRLMATDYSTGRFILGMQADGNLVFYTIALVSGYHYGPYWASNTVGNGTKLVFNETGDIYLVLRNNSRFNVTSAHDSTSNFYQRATLDYDGVFRQYIYPKNNSIAAKGGWTNGWTLVDYLPEDICTVSGGSPLGSGICGFNSYCKFSLNQTVDCECPPEYSFLDPIRKYKGCKPDFTLQSCDTDQSGQFDFLTLSGIDFQLADYEQYYSVDEDTCRQQCLNDCFCSAALFNQGYCRKKKFPLSNGLMDASSDSTLFLKVPKNNGSQTQPSKHNGWKKDKKNWILAGSILLGSSVFANILLVLAIVIGTHHCWKRKMQNHEYEPRLKGQGPRFFTYKELQSATNNFTDKIGHGGSGEVYKGFTHDEANLCVAVKKIDIKVLDETEKEFTAEVQTIGQTFHKNLVRLLGFCNEESHRLVVYEFMSQGSLNDFLFFETRPNWNKRLQVALGIARGLLYLHEECNTQIIHCDIKPQNVLLDENLTPKISDFGLAKLLRTDQTRTNTGIRGTKGYVAPEWFKNVGITSKVDIYSFGVILLEIICCRRNVDSETENEEQMILAYWVNDCYRERRLDLVVEGDEEAAHDMKRVERFVKVALWCIQEEPSLRPTMLKVTQMLDGAVDIPMPPDPSSYISSIQ